MIYWWWLIPTALVTAVAVVAVMALFMAGSRAEDIDDAYREGFTAGAAEAAKDIGPAYQRGLADAAKGAADGR